MKRWSIFVVLLLVGVWSWAQAPRRVILRFSADSPEAIVESVTTFGKTDLLFAMERLQKPEDTPAMKAALAQVLWKNNELIAAVPELPSIDVVEVVPETVDAIIEQAHADIGFADTIRFRAGDVFRGHLEAQSGTPGQPIVYMAYGSGEKPILEPSFDASSPEDWVKVGRKLWKCEKDSRNELGNVILNHGAKGCAFKVDKPEQLGRKDLRFCWVRDEHTVYMVSRRNPATRFQSIELAEKQHIIDETDCHDIEYDGLWLRYGAAHGIGGSGVRGITVRNCDISWIGGSTLYYDEGGRGVRYGNGIEFWSAAQDILVEGCRLWECWDAALTNQSNVDGVLQKNIIYRGNEIWNSDYSYEYWQQGDGARTEDILFENNVCRDAGYGWGHKQRWNPNAAHLMFYDTTAETSNFVVRGNRFLRSKNVGMRLFNAWYSSLTLDGNEWYIPCHILCRYHARPTSGLIFKYPDHLDSAHIDDEAEIQSQTVEKPRVFRYGKRALREFRQFLGINND